MYITLSIKKNPPSNRYVVMKGGPHILPEQVSWTPTVFRQYAKDYCSAGYISLTILPKDMNKLQCIQKYWINIHYSENLKNWFYTCTFPQFPDISEILSKHIWCSNSTHFSHECIKGNSSSRKFRLRQQKPE